MHNLRIDKNTYAPIFEISYVLGVSEPTLRKLVKANVVRVKERTTDYPAKIQRGARSHVEYNTWDVAMICFDYISTLSSYKQFGVMSSWDNSLRALYSKIKKKPICIITK